MSQFVHHEMPLIPGWDVAGHRGDGSAGHPFQTRCGFVAPTPRNGGQLVTSWQRPLKSRRRPKPSARKAAILPASQTAWMSLFEAAGPNAAGAHTRGVGGRHVCRHFESCRRHDRHDFGRNFEVVTLGADEVIDRRERFFCGRGVDAVRYDRGRNPGKSGATRAGVVRRWEQKAAAAHGSSVVHARFNGRLQEISACRRRKICGDRKRIPLRGETQTRRRLREERSFCAIYPFRLQKHHKNSSGGSFLI
jgi:hypothetical protein